MHVDARSIDIHGGAGHDLLDMRALRQGTHNNVGTADVRGKGFPGMGHAVWNEVNGREMHRVLRIEARYSVGQLPLIDLRELHPPEFGFPAHMIPPSKG